MGYKIEATCGICEISRAGYGIQISWRNRDVLISIGEMPPESYDPFGLPIPKVTGAATFGTLR